MNATLMKRLFRVLQDGSSTDVQAVCRRMVDEEKKPTLRSACPPLESEIKLIESSLAG